MWKGMEKSFIHNVLRAILCLLALLGFVMVAVTFTPLTGWWGRALAGGWNDPKGEVLIVLGAGTIDESTLAPSSYWRSIYADRAYRRGGFRTVLVSGSEVAPLMADFLVCHGVPAGAILMDNASTSTHENTLYAKLILANVPGRKVLLTSDYHMFRARRCFEKAGVLVLASPFPDALKRGRRHMGRWGVFLDLVVETAKIVYYRARGWI